MEEARTVKSTAETLTDHVSDYVETYLKLTIVNATQKATGVASVSIAGILLLLFFTFVLFFSGIGLSLWLGEALDDLKGGFFVVSIVYLILGLLTYVLRKEIVFPFVRNTIIRKVYEDH